MNYLAHLYLSFDDPKITIGNFIADAVKGNKHQLYEKEISMGILVHREIDSFMDTHPLVKQGKRRLSKYRHYAGVIMDVIYDHYLSKNWQQYSDEPLNEFTQRHYQLLWDHEVHLPDKMSYLLSHMSADDWLYNYQFMEGIQFALSGMSRRTKFKSDMEHATSEIQQYYQEFETEFHAYFHEIIDHIHNFTDQLKQA